MPEFNILLSSLVFQLKKNYESLLEFALSQSMTQKNKANTLQLQFVFTYACHSPVLFMVVCAAMIPFHTSFFPCLKKNKIK